MKRIPIYFTKTGIEYYHEVISVTPGVGQTETVRVRMDGTRAECFKLLRKMLQTPEPINFYEET